MVFLSIPPSFSMMVTCRYHSVLPSGSHFSPSSSARAATGLIARVPALCYFCCTSSCCCCCLGCLFDEETRQLQDGGLRRTKEIKKHAITTAIAQAIT